MSLQPQPLGEIPELTAHIAHAAFPKASVVMWLRDEFGRLYDDEDFRARFSTRGRPALPPWRLALVTVLQFMEHLSDRQAAEMLRARIDWKYALSLELDDPGFHFSVLAEFRARLVQGRQEALLLDKMLERFKVHGLVKARGKQRTDSTHVLAAVRDLHLCELVGETMRAALNDLAVVAPDWLQSIVAPEWYKRYGHRVEDYRLPHGVPNLERYAVEVGEDGFALLDALEAQGAPQGAREVPMVATLRKMWSLHFIRQNGRVVWRAPKTLPPVGERLQSPYDPEMHYSTKRNLEWSGYKVHFTESCDQDTVHLITHVHTTPAMAYDGSSTAVIHQKLADKGLAPAEHDVDSAYVDAELLVTSQRDHGIQLMGPIRQSSSWQTRMGQGYDLPHFQVDWEREQVTCPQGKTSVSWQPTKRRDAQGEPPRIAARFGRADCGPCVARSLCTPAKEARRAVYLHLRDEYEALRAARIRMHDPVWKVQYQVRAGIEGTLSQGVRAFGVRRSRYVGLAKTGLHEVLAATGINALRVADWLRSKPRAKTRVSPFVGLGAVT